MLSASKWIVLITSLLKTFTKSISDKGFIMHMQQNETFIEDLVIPSFIGLVNQDMVIGIHDINGVLIIPSQKYANLLGFSSYKDAMNKKGGVDFPLIRGNSEFWTTFDKHMEESGEITDYVSTIDDQFYLSTCEPIFDHNNKVLAIKSFTRQFKIISHKEIAYSHFKKFSTNVATLSNIQKPDLTEKEASVLFMLITGYSQSEIAEYLHCSRSLVAKIISEGLCPKFKISGSASKILIDKAINLGLASFIPHDFLNKAHY